MLRGFEREASGVTATQFIFELEKVQDQFVWKLEVNTGPGSERRAQPRFWIRAYPRDHEGAVVRLDPVGAVCYAVSRKIHEPGYWPDAAEALGLDLGDGLNVVSAANDSTWKDHGTGRRQPDAYLQALRRRLMEAVGLEEEEAAAP